MRRIEEAGTVSPEDQELLAEIKQIVTGMLPDATVLLYGSTARGERQQYSDYDVLVMTERAMTRREQDEVRDALFELQFEREVLVTTLFYSRAEWDGPIAAVGPFRANVERDALVI